MLQLCNWNIEPEEIDTSKNHLICFRVAFWKRDMPIFEVVPSTEEPQRYYFEYEKRWSQNS